MSARKLRLICLAGLLVLCFGLTTQAQLPQDVRDVFEGMLDDLDGELQAKFRGAIRNESATVEFTPAQFRRFRENPANPFEGLGEINAEDSGGNIALKFELPSMRNRTLRPFERQDPSTLMTLQAPANSASASTVAIFSGDRQVAMGIVVNSEGFILTKATEIENRGDIHCVLSDERKLKANVLRTNSENDLAILKIDAQDLPVVHWSDKRILTGAFLITPATDGSVIAMGTYSVPPRSTAEGEQAFLGVKPETTPNGVRISDIRSGTASHVAGLRDDDVITKLGGVIIPDVSSLVKTIRDRRPGDKVEIEYMRNGTAAKAQATLAGRDVSGEQAARFKMMNRLGAVPSRRDDNFPSVFQHDTPLFPEQCGGPITDLEGNVMGINIARVGRAASYAIPAAHVQTLLKDLLRENVASR
jgi:S1-C subfamily serine protease